MTGICLCERRGTRWQAVSSENFRPDGTVEHDQIKSEGFREGPVEDHQRRFLNGCGAGGAVEKPG